VTTTLREFHKENDESRVVLMNFVTDNLYPGLASMVSKLVQGKQGRANQGRITYVSQYLQKGNATKVLEAQGGNRNMLFGKHANARNLDTISFPPEEE
jgi:hypothetical protein